MQATEHPLVEELADCTPPEQEARLRGDKALRTPDFVRAYIEKVEAARFERPKDVMRLMEVVVREVVPKLRCAYREKAELHCRGLAAYAACCRLIGRFEVAAQTLRMALRIATQNELTGLKAELLQRACYLLREDARFEDALKVISGAIALYAEASDVVGIAQMLVARAAMLRGLGRNAEAVEAYQAALAGIPVEDRYRLWRATVFQGLGTVCREDGRIEEASIFYDRALELYEDSINKAHMAWLNAHLWVKRGDLIRAEALYREARVVLGAANPYDAALVSLDLVETLIGLRRIDEAVQIAKEMAALLTPLRHNRFASAAIVEFSRQVITGQLTKAVIGRARVQVERGRKGDSPRALSSRKAQDSG